jgi:hypothetical protein
MTRTREDLKNNVRIAQEKLEEAERELRRHDSRPVGCVCDPRDWGYTPGPICDEFVADPESGDCRKCDHMRECHQELPR